MPSFKSKTSVLILSMALCAGGLVGCDRETPARKAVRQAGQDLEMLSAGAGSLKSAKGSEYVATYTGVQTLVEPHKKSEEPGLASAANLLSARASAGLGDIESERVAGLEREGVAMLVRARQQLDLYTQQAALAAAAAKKDLTSAIMELQKQVEDQASQKNGFAGKLAAANAEHAKLVSATGALLDQAKTKRRQVTDLQAQLAGKSAAEGLDIVKRAAEVSREADKAERQAAEVQVQADEVQSTVNDLTRSIGAAEQTLKLLEESIKSLRAGGEASKEQAASAKASAAAMATDLTKTIGEYDAFRGGDLAKRSGDAERNFNEAIKSARAGSTGLSAAEMTSAKLALGTYQQSLADVLMGRARSSEAFAMLLTGAEKAEPALPDRLQIAERAGKARDEAKANLDAARQAYTEAKDTLEGVNGLPDAAKQRLEKIGATLAALSGAKVVEAPKAEAAKPAVDEKKPDAKAATEGVEMQVRDMLKRAQAAMVAKDTKALLQMSIVENADDGLMEGMAALTDGVLKLDSACRDKLGMSLKDALSGPFAGMGMIAERFIEESKEDVSQYKVAVDSPTSARVTDLKGDVNEARLVNGEWKMVFDAAKKGLPEGQLGMIKTMGPKLGTAMSQLADDVNSGRIKDAERLNFALTGKLGGMGGPPGVPPPK